MQNLENLDVFEILITQKLLKCPKDPFLRSMIVCNIAAKYEKDTLKALGGDEYTKYALLAFIQYERVVQN